MNFDIQKLKRKSQKFFELNNIVFLIAIAISISLIWNTISAIEKNFSLQTRVDNLGSEVELLALENENLSLNNEYYKTDSFLELAARDTLNLVASGENVLVLPDYDDLKQAAEQQTAAVAAEAAEVSNTDRWLYFLFRRQP